MKRIPLVPAGSLAAAAVVVLAVLVFSGCKKDEATSAPAPAGATTNATAALPAGVTPYPLSNCVVSGEKLGGDMGAPVEFVYQNQEIKFCCSMCQPKFLKDPDPYMKKIKD